MHLLLFLATFAGVFRYYTSIPSRLVARAKHRKDWEIASDLTDLEKYQATVAKEYSEWLEHTPFFYVSVYE